MDRNYLDAMYQNLFESSHDAITFCSMDGHYLQVNDAFCKMLGLDRDELLALRYQDLTPPHFLSIETKILSSQLLENGYSEEYEKEFICRDGSTVSTSVRVSLLRNFRGEPLGMWSIVRNLTDRKRVDQALRESERRMRQIIDAIPIMLFARDGYGRYLFANKTMAKFYNMLPQEMEGISQAMLHAHAPNEVRQFLEDDYDVMQSGHGGYLIEEASTDPAGNKYILETRKLPIHIGNQPAVLGVAIDITERRYMQEALTQSETRYRMIVESAPEAIVMFDLNHSRFCDCNQKAERLFGYSRDQLFLQSPIELSPLYQPDGQPSAILINRMLSRVSQGESISFEWIFNNAYGEDIPCEVRLTRISEQNRIVIRGSIFDLREQKRSHQYTENIETLLNETGKLAQVGGWQLHPVEHLLFWTEQTYLLHEVSPDFSPNLDSMLDFYKGEARENLAQALKSLELAGKPFDLILPMTTARKHERWVRMIGRAKRQNSGTTVLSGAIQDVTRFKEVERKLRENESRLHYLAHHDALTGLPNRLLFADRLEHALMRASRENGTIALLLMDLDRFKLINDTLGHDIGDQLIQVVSKRLKKHLREQDTAARLGGDEFVIILENIERIKEVTIVAEKILKAVSDPFRVGTHELMTTASIGVSLFPADGDRPETLIKHADVAMYRAKAVGKNNYQFFTTDLNQRALELLLLENDLRRAVELNQFILHYQPIYDVSRSAIIGAEALVRWQHPQRGLLMPDEFIAIAEETGLITPLGKLVMEEACRQFRSWIEAGLPLHYLSVNVSAIQFRQEIGSCVQETLRRTGLAPHHLMIEITENVVMQDIDSSLQVLRELADLGLNLAIDDFGTGYSSLSYLKQLPLASLKIDRSFVIDILDNHNDAAIATSIIALAHQMGLKVVAEGVESKGQFDFLKLHECDLIQGFHFGKPFSAQEFPERLMAVC